jgi:ubiquinone/menaquinone biosynthesis C-methylase UbiE
MKTSRHKKDLAITGWMAQWYDGNTRKSRLAEMRANADFVSQTAPVGAKVLEVAPGPGYLSIELAKRGFDVTGMELSPDFVEIEKRNAKAEGVSIDFRQGNASAMPLRDGAFDFIICAAAFKNFSEPLKALQEMHRVLMHGGTALILDMNRNNTKEDIEAEMQKYSNMKGFDRWFVRFSFKTFLRNGAYTQEELEGLISQTNFARHEIKKHGIGFQVWMWTSLHQ